LILSGLLQSAIPFTQTFFVAQLGTKALAAGAIAVTTLSIVYCLIFGVLTATNILIAREYGAGKTKNISIIMRGSFQLGAVLTVLCFLVFWFFPYFLVLIGQPPTITQLVSSYMHAMIPGLPPLFIFIILSDFYLGLGKTQILLKITVIDLLVILLFSYIFIFGKLGMPALGILGAGLAVSVANWTSALVLVLYTLSCKEYQLAFRGLLSKSNQSYTGELIKVGIPLALTYCVETVSFFVFNLLMASLGILFIAASQIVIQYLYIFCGIYTAISRAITIQMGYFIGSGTLALAKKTAYFALIFNLSLALIVSILFWYFPRIIISLDLDINETNKSIISLAEKLLLMGAMYQFFESLRMVFTGVLLSYKRTVSPLIITIICYWLIALPLGYVLAYKFQYKGEGLWLGLVAGNAIATFLLFIALKWNGSYGGDKDKKPL
jgi:MATE family multidrug resistance protein